MAHCDAVGERGIHSITHRAEEFIGLAGTDTVTYLAATAGVSASLTPGLHQTGAANEDRYDSNENLTGSRHRDDLRGDDLANVLTGPEGNDTLSGGDGNNTLEGGTGADSLIRGAGSNVLVGDIGADTLQGGKDNDTLNGGFGFDRMNGGADADSFFHFGVADHGSDRAQDYNAADGDGLQVGIAGATVAQFQSKPTFTPGAGSAEMQEAFVIHRPTWQILWTLVDGGDDAFINLPIGWQVFDLMASAVGGFFAGLGIVISGDQSSIVVFFQTTRCLPPDRGAQLCWPIFN